MLYHFPAEPRARRIFSRRKRSASSWYERPLKAWESCLVGCMTGLFMGIVIVLAFLRA